MSTERRTQITGILNQLDAGRIDGEPAAEQLFTLIYGELRGLARGLMRAERSGHTLQATALVHEAYLRLIGETGAQWQNRAHFFGAAARAMRQILVDHARGRGAAKRGGGWARITFGEDLAAGSALQLAILDLDEALQRLAELDERMVRVVELRIFGGLQMQEIADYLSVSRSTVQKDWRVAKMWLARELGETTADEGPSS